MTTVEQTTNGAAPSLLESGLRWAQSGLSARARRQGGAARPGVLRRAFSALGELLGTLLALAAFTVAAFAVGFVLGMAVAGVAFLLLDFKVSLVRRARASAGRRQ